MSAPLLALQDVTRRIRGPVPVTLVEDATLAIEAGEYVAVTGPSGCGKSSLLYLIGLLDRPDSGSVAFAGADTARLGSDALARLRLEKIGFVFQFHFLLGEFTALENVMLPMKRLGRRGEAEIVARAETLLDHFGLAARAGRRPHQLSGGERQRVAIARAFVGPRELLLADEPTGALDSVTGELVMRLLAAECARGKTAVLVTHDASHAAWADRVLHLRDGRFVDGSGRSAGAVAGA